MRQRLLPSIVLLWILGAAASQCSAGELFVRVRKGDTLFGIARSFSTTVDRIRRDNRLKGDLIHPGQSLVLKGTSGVARQWKGKVRVDLPMHGLRKRDIVTRFGQLKNQRHKKVSSRHTGIDLRAREGTPIIACARGVVRFVGDLGGFGRLVVVEHAGGWRSVYSPLDPGRVEVSVNEAVYRGQRLGRLGTPVETEKPALHFELRKKDKAVDPTGHLRW